MGNNTTIHGYLSLTPDSGIDLTTDQGKAVSVSFLPGKAADVLHLDMVCRDPVSRAHAELTTGSHSTVLQLNAPNRVFPYLGVALLVSHQDNQNTVPDQLPGVSSDSTTSRRGVHIADILRNAPTASSRCKVSPSVTSREVQLRNRVPFATWTLSACGES